MSALVNRDACTFQFLKASRLLHSDLLRNRGYLALGVLGCHDRLSLHLVNNILHKLAPLHLLVTVDVDLLE